MTVSARIGAVRGRDLRRVATPARPGFAGEPVDPSASGEVLHFPAARQRSAPAPAEPSAPILRRVVARASAALPVVALVLVAIAIVYVATLAGAMR